MSNSPPLKTLVHQLWKSKAERQGISTEFKLYFLGYIGVEDQREYNNILATLKSKAEEDERHTVLFDNSLPFEVNFDFMNNIKSELERMDVFHLKNEDLLMFPDTSYNQLFVSSVQEIINLAVQKENFPNDSVRNNFITKLLLHVYNHILPKTIADPIVTTNKCIYYGNIERHDAYFLLLLSKMQWDVLYLNPLKEVDFLQEVGLAFHVNKQILPIETFESRTSSGVAIQQFDSITLGFEQEMEQELFTGSGLFRPWQFKKGTTKNLFFNSTIIDLENNWNEEARVRQGFSVDGRVVQVPNFFYEIEGEYTNQQQYKELVQKLTKSPNLILSKGQVADFLDITASEQQVFEISFCQLNDGAFDTEKLKELSFYKYAPFNDDTERFILEKINETLLDTNLFATPLASKTDVLMFVAVCLQLNKKVIRLIDSFDYPFAIPKIVVFLDKETSIDGQLPYILGFLHKMGFDIAVFSPAGMSDLSSYITRGRFNWQRLETINYERTYDYVQSIVSRSKGGFFSKLFGS